MPHFSDPLAGMTWERWQALSAAERMALRDTSALHPKLIGCEGRRIACHREGKARTFTVGISTGWRPIHLAMRRNVRGSSDVIRADETITGIHLAR